MSRALGMTRDRAKHAGHSPRVTQAVGVDGGSTREHTRRVMSRRPRVSDELYRASRTARDIETVASGNPQRIARRIRNKIVGHFIGRWLRRLWL